MFKSRWWIVLGSFLGLMVGSVAIEVFGTGVFIKPLAQDLHLGRGVITSAMGLASLMTAVMAVVSGRLMDKYGVRVVLLPLLLWFAVLTSTLALLSSGAVLMLMVIFSLQGMGGQTPVPYGKMITARFDDRRGLALGLALAGAGAGTALIPQYSRLLLQHWGWRGGYLGIGVAIIVLSFIPVSLWFGETPQMKLARQKGSAERRALPGMEFSEVARMPRFWLLALAFFFTVLSINGSLIHVVPMLTDRGVSLRVAVSFMSGAGAALIVGRVIAGYLLDRIFAAYIVIFFLICPMAGIAILPLRVPGTGPAYGVVLLGVGVGSEIDMLAYLVSRYFGVKAFGLMFGIMMGAAALADALGNNLMGWCYQLKHTYAPALVIMEILLALAIVIQATMGPYRYPAMKPGQPLKLQADAAGSNRPTQ